MDDTLISVVVPFYNASHSLPACLEAMAGQSYAEAEYFFVDNNSMDGGDELVRRAIAEYDGLEIRLLAESKRGASAARNKGVMEARGSHIAFTDADCIPRSEWLADLAAAIAAHPDCGAFAGRIQPAPPSNLVEKAPALFTLPPNEKEETYHRYTPKGGGFATANLTVSRELFLDIGGFDERLFFGEDHTLCAGIYQRGYGIRTLKNAQVDHQHRASVKGMCKQAFGYGKFHALSLRNLVPGALILEAPLLRVAKIDSGSRLWIDLNQADKKFLAILLLGWVWIPLLALAPLYLIYLSAWIRRKGRILELPVGWAEAPLVAFLLVVKSVAMGFGRLVGSWCYRVLCI